MVMRWNETVLLDITQTYGICKCHERTKDVMKQRLIDFAKERYSRSAI